MEEAKQLPGPFLMALISAARTLISWLKHFPNVSSPNMALEGKTSTRGSGKYTDSSWHEGSGCHPQLPVNCLGASFGFIGNKLPEISELPATVLQGTIKDPWISDLSHTNTKNYTSNTNLQS